MFGVFPIDVCKKEANRNDDSYSVAASMLTGSGLRLDGGAETDPRDYAYN